MLVFQFLFLLPFFFICPFFWSREISYQIHSFNDFREWEQLFRKNVSWIKIDPQYLPHEECLKQTRVLNPGEKGCLVFNHNSVHSEKKGEFRNDYNSSDDFLFMAKYPEKFSYFWKSGKVHISLCFKFYYGDVCNKTNIHGKNFISLIDDFIATLNHSMIQNNLTAEIILDGDATPGGKTPRSCLAQKWRPLNATLITDRDPTDALYHDDATKGEDRFSILDLPLGQLEVVELVHHFGKFRNRVDYPVLLWEPAEQSVIIIESKLFLENASAVDVPLRFAINIDPVQFEVYSAQSKPVDIGNGYAWNIFLENTATSEIEDHKIASIPCQLEPHLYKDNHQPHCQQHVFIVVFQRRSLCELSYRLYVGEENFGRFSSLGNEAKFSETDCKYGKIILLDVLQFLNDTKTTSSWVLQIVYSSGYVFEYGINNKNKNKHNIFNVDFSFSFLRKYSLGNDELYFSMEHFESSASSVDGNKMHVITSRTSQCELLVSASGGYSPICLIKKQKRGLNSGGEGAVSAVSTGSHLNEIILLYNPTANISEIHAFLLSLDGSNRPRSGEGEGGGGKINIEHHHRGQIDVGTDIAMRVSAKTGHVLEVHSNGFCFNTEENNKRSDVGVCDLQPSPIPETLVYNYAPFESFKRIVLMDDQIMHVCRTEEGFIHGVFDEGSRPAIDLYYDYDPKSNTYTESDVVPRVNVVELHVGKKGIGSPCGAAMNYDGLVLDSWRSSRL